MREGDEGLMGLGLKIGNLYVGRMVGVKFWKMGRVGWMG